MLSGGLKLVPEFMIGAAGFGGSPTANAAEGGTNFGGSAEDAVNMTALDLRDELARQADYLELLADARVIAIRGDAQGQLQAYATLFLRPPSNMLSNAVNHSPEVAEITLCSRQDGDKSRCPPRHGIAAEHLPRLFDHFFCGDPGPCELR